MERSRYAFKETVYGDRSFVTVDHSRPLLLACCLGAFSIGVILTSNKSSSDTYLVTAHRNVPTTGLAITYATSHAGCNSEPSVLGIRRTCSTNSHMIM